MHIVHGELLIGQPGQHLGGDLLQEGKPGFIRFLRSVSVTRYVFGTNRMVVYHFMAINYLMVTFRNCGETAGGGGVAAMPFANYDISINSSERSCLRFKSSLTSTNIGNGAI